MSDATRLRLEERYADLAGNLKACWSFERFLNRLTRTRAGAELEMPRLDLPALRDRLTALARDLEGGDSASLARRLEEIETELHRSIGRLSAQDSRVGASDLRRFLTRARRLDEDLLLEMLRFHMYASRGESWDAERVDKIDFLLSRLGEAICGPLLARDRIVLKASLTMLWQVGAAPAPRRPVLLAMRQRVGEMSARLGAARSLDELEEMNLIREYRQLKHGMGRVLVEPSIAVRILETNAALGRAIQRLYGEEEWSLAADFARFAELERSGVGEALSLELASLRRDMERLEAGRQVDDFRLSTLQEMRRQVEALRPQLVEESRPGRPEEAPEESPLERLSLLSEPIVTLRPEEVTVAPEIEAEEDATAVDPGREMADRLFEQLESLLAASGSLDEAESALQDPGLPFGLERREITAFLGLREAGEGGAEADRMVLTGAALRLRLMALHDQLAAGMSGSVEARASRALDLSERLLAQFDGEIVAAARAGETRREEEARFLKMLLTREYSTLWLELHGGP